jgi:nucleoside 2-deoxyribosyltransferase
MKHLAPQLAFNFPGFPEDDEPTNKILQFPTMSELTFSGPIRKIYLAGLISVDYPESLAWRTRIAPRLEEIGFEILTPLHGKKNLKAHTPDGGITSTMSSSKSIILRDRRDVRECDVVLAHLEDFGSPRPLLGTIAELAWCWDQRTPVVGIARPDNILMRKHPFMVEFISEYVKDEDEAVAFLKRYYGPIDS